MTFPIEKTSAGLPHKGKKFPADFFARPPFAAFYVLLTLLASPSPKVSGMDFSSQCLLLRNKKSRYSRLLVITL
ncbi:MAG: hypothetical protein IPP46_18525 [Bacteroidetes bacterium]|nr:hypothetical protein [Bacteroidota bacterium]